MAEKFNPAPHDPHVRAIHRFDVVGQFGVADVDIRFHIHEIKMIERHRNPP